MPVLGKVAEKLVLLQNKREADLAMANIKTNLENQAYREDQSTTRLHSILSDKVLEASYNHR
jgi:hypothetical protein